MKLKFWEKNENDKENINEEGNLPILEEYEKTNFFSNISQKIGNYWEKNEPNYEVIQEEIISPEITATEEGEKTDFFSNISQTLGDYWDKGCQGIIDAKNFVSDTYDEHFITEEIAIKILINILPTIIKLVAVAAAIPSPQTKILLLALPILKGLESYYLSNYKIIDDELIKIADGEFSLDLKESISHIIPVI